MSKQSTLFKYNFTKKILHRDKLVDDTESTGKAYNTWHVIRIDRVRTHFCC